MNLFLYLKVKVEIEVKVKFKKTNLIKFVLTLCYYYSFLGFHLVEYQFFFLVLSEYLHYLYYSLANYIYTRIHCYVFQISYNYS